MPGLLPQVAWDGKTARGTVRADGTRVHLLSAFDARTGLTLAQREVNAKSNEIPELVPMLEALNIVGKAISTDALHGQRVVTAACSGPTPRAAFWPHLVPGDGAVL